jgi:predicted nucleic acid-binding protein
MAAILIDINDPNIQLPEFIVLDASVVLELRVSPNRQRHHNSAINFFRRLRPLASSGQVMPLLPLLALEECYFKICQYKILEFLANNNIQTPWHRYYKQNPQIIQNTVQNLQVFYNILRSFPIVVIEPEDLAVLPIDTEPRLSERMKDFIQNFLILPKDATILSNAERLGIDTVVTLDSDWSRADGFKVITVI